MSRRLHSSISGVTAIEFAIVAPVFLILVFAVCDIGQMLYARALLGGAVEDAARAGTTETVDTDSIDAAVEAVVRPIVPSAVFTFSRESYSDFTDVGRPEKFTDSNSNGTCDNSEAYIDENGNGQWDADVGKSGNGGADDIVLYSVTATYTPLIAVPLLPKSTSDITISARAVRKNQPFTTQSSYSTTAGTCS